MGLCKWKEENMQKVTMINGDILDLLNSETPLNEWATIEWGSAA